MKYRFRTKGEFIRDYGTSWQNECNWYWHMDYLFGLPVTFDMSLYENTNSNYITGLYPELQDDRKSSDWNINRKTLIEFKPDYTPKKLIK